MKTSPPVTHDPKETNPMPRRTRYGRRPCPCCGERVTTNALGRAAHMRHCNGPNTDPVKESAAKVADRIDGYDRDDLGESPDY